MNLTEHSHVWRITKQDVIIACLGFSFWCSLYLALFQLQPLPIEESLAVRWTSLLISGLHGSFIGISALLFVAKKITFPIWEKIVGITRGYFLYDIAFVLLSSGSVNPLDSLFFVLHHLLLIGITLYVAEYKELLAVGFVSEVALPVLYAFWYVDITSASPFLYYLLGGATLVTYFVFRVCNFTYLMFKVRYVLTPKTRWRIVLFVPILFMNYFWFYKILVKAIQGLSV